MKILHAASTHAFLGFLEGHATYQVAQGHDVHVVADAGPGLRRMGEIGGVTCHTVNIRREMNPVGDLRTLVAAMRLIQDLRPDVVHSHTPKAGLLFTLAAALLRVRVRIYHAHGLPLETASGLRRKILLTTEWIACHAATQVLSVSRSLADRLMQLGLAPVGRVHVPGHGSISGVQIDVFNPTKVRTERARTRAQLGVPPDALVLGFVGRMTKDKGLEDLGRAWLGIAHTLPQAHLMLVGSRESGDPVDPALWVKLVQHQRVHWVEWADEMAPLYSAMDVVCLPSHREGFGQVALEAAAMELPMVAYRVTGLVDAVVAGETGTLVSRGDWQSLARSAIDYLQDPRLASRHGRAGRVRANRDFDPVDLHADVLDTYSE